MAIYGSTVDSSLENLLKEKSRIKKLIEEKKRHVDVYSVQFMKRKTYDQLINGLSINGRPDVVSRETGLFLVADQIRILEHMMTTNIPIHKVPSLGSLFTHVDNIRYIYDNDGAALPEWYRDKYGHLFENKLLV